MDFQAFQETYPLLYAIIVFAIIMVLTWVVEHIIFKLIQGFGNKTNSPLPSSTIFANIARVAIWLAGFALAAKVAFNYDLTGVVAALGVGGIALSLGMQDTLQNLIGGLQVSIGKLVEPGDFVEVDAMRGKVVDINWRHTVIQDQSGPTYIIPNSVMNSAAITKLGESGWRYLPFQLPVSANMDRFSEHALKKLREAIPEDTLGPQGIDIRFAGEELGLVSGMVMIDTLHGSCSNSVTLDRATRALDEVLKEAGGTVVEKEENEQ